uniref:Uncharacterized protein n=1 Tax=Anguilla anguilla TaxID=7936 RepID=A0A0E9T3G6_ANGAN
MKCTSSFCLFIHCVPHTAYSCLKLHQINQQSGLPEGLSVIVRTSACVGDTACDNYSLCICCIVFSPWEAWWCSG